jgi:hypothetical protein
MDQIKNQLFTIGMLNTMRNNGTNNASGTGQDSMFSMIYGMILITIIDNVMKMMPQIGTIINGHIENFVKKKKDDIIGTITPETKALIVFELEKNSTLVCNEIPDALMEYCCNQNSTIKLIYRKKYSINNKESFKLNYRDIECRLISEKVSMLEESQPNEKIIFEIFSKEMTLSELRTWIDKIVHDYRIIKKNQLENKKYYFNEFPVIPPKNPDGTYRLESSFKTLIFTMTEFNTNKSLKNMFGKDIIEVKKLVDLFTNHHEWYYKRGIPHTLGFLLHGPPGTGKTSTIKAIAKDTSRHLINVALRETTTQRQLLNLFHDETISVMTQNGETKTFFIPFDQRIYVIEDVDCLTDVVLDRKYVEERDNQKNKMNDENIVNEKFKIGEQTSLRNSVSEHQEQKINLSFLLNLLDGVLETPNRIVIMTSNYPERIDKALIRPGRIDLIIKFGNCTSETISQIFEYFYCDVYCLDSSSNRNTIFNFDEKYSGLVSPAMICQILCRNYNNKETGYKNLIEYFEEKLKEKLKESEIPSQESFNVHHKDPCDDIHIEVPSKLSFSIEERTKILEERFKKDREFDPLATRIITKSKQIFP